MADGKGLLTQIEDKLGLPKLSRVVDSVAQFDPKQLREAKELLDRIERVAKVAPDLDKVLMLIRELRSMTPTEWHEVNKALGHLDHIVTKSPQEVVDAIKKLVDKLPEIINLLASLKGE